MCLKGLGINLEEDPLNNIISKTYTPNINHLITQDQAKNKAEDFDIEEFRKKFVAFLENIYHDVVTSRRT